MAQIYQGQLYKYTNVVKGWQYRWFILKPETGILEYYLATQAEEAKFQRPRGLIPLSGAVVSPSDEDSNTFTVNSSNGEIYKLRGINAKERQEWVDRLRAVAEHHAQASNLVAAQNTNREPWPNVPNVPAISNPQVPPTSTGSSSSSSQHGHRQHHRRSPPEQIQQQQHHHVSDVKQQPQQSNPTARAQQRVMENTRSIYDAFSAAQEILVRAEYGHHTLAKAIEDLPNHGPDVRCIDPDMLLLKATSQATLLCLKQCHAMLQQQQQAASFSQMGVTGGAMMEWLDPFSYSLNWNNANTTLENVSSSPMGSSLQVSIIADNNDNINYNSEDEKTDEEDFADIEISSAEEHRALTLQLLSQFKLGMDLTRVVLPAFILEPRSLLEMYSDLMKHPDIFIKIPKEISPEARLMAIVEWYLTAFNLGRKGGFSANKPYNPIIGELFFCSWIVEDSTDDVGDGDNISHSDKRHKLKFVAEQVSHHPPISAFYVESSDHDICMNASIATKSKFMGMSVAVNIVGEAVLNIPQYEEEYVITFPSAYARSVLSTPWVELCGKTAITCNKTGYSASVTFHTKPFYGGKLHRITAEVKNSNGGTICKVQGEWNGVLEFMCANGESKFIDTTSLAVYRKRVKPVNLQSELESRKVWKHVTSALKEEDIATATENKRMIEECQRYKARQWQETGHHFSPRLFQMVGDNWQYNDHLKIKN